MSNKEIEKKESNESSDEFSTKLSSLKTKYKSSESESSESESDSFSKDEDFKPNSSFSKTRKKVTRRAVIKYSSDDDNSDNSDSEDDQSSDDPYDEEEDEEASESDNDDDDDDEDYFERRKSTRGKSKNTKSKNNAKQSKSNVTTSKNNKKNYQEKRKTSKKVNYCEDESESDIEDSKDYVSYKNDQYDNSSEKPQDDPNLETIEKVLKCRQGQIGATGSKTAIYNIEENGDPNEGFSINKESNFEYQYLIKWLGWSHLHNTWESKESLLQQKVKGMKKIENFEKKEEELRLLKQEATTPEDIEYLECQSEMIESLYDSHKYAERIIADNQIKNPNGYVSIDYLCKWQGLPYSDCTWEDGDLIKKRFPKFIEEFNMRQNSQTLPPVNIKTQKAMKIRPRFVTLKEKPDYFGGHDPELKLRDYQLEGLNWLANSWCKQNGIILADEMGLGKTIQTISFLSYVFNEHNLYGPFLIVIPLSTIQGWQREFQKWSPEINVVIYLGDANSRNMIQKYEWYSANKKYIKCNVILTTYEILLKDKAFFNSVSWASLIVDEAHRLKNEDSLLYRTLIKFCTNHRILITGTPLQNSLKELWALLHFIMPEKFNSWEEFDAKYSHTLSDGIGFQELHKELQPYLLRRVKKDVEKSLPAKVEQILRVEMTKIQKQYYKLILTKNFKELNKGAKGNVNSFLNIMMELKKCSNHIFLIRRDETSDVEKLIKGSGKLLLLDKLLRRLKETGHRVLIFSQMVRMLDIIAEYLHFRRFPFQRLDGSIKGEIRRQALDHFNKEDSEDFCFLLSTRAGGLGINLSTADTVIIYDSDWNPQNDLQAQARAHRIGQKNQVNIYRLVSKNSMEEDIVERAKQKMVLDHLVIQRMDTTGRTVLNKTNMPGSSSIPFTKDEINSILKFGAEELFKEKDTNPTQGDQVQDEREEMYDIDEILKRAETREETNHTSASEELLSQFKVANFSTMEDDPILPNHTRHMDSKSQEDLDSRQWSDIIPESERMKVEMEEENEKIRQINLILGNRRNRGGMNETNKKLNDNTSDNNQETDSDESDGGKKSSKSKKNKSESSQHTIRGLNAQEVRRFVRSYRKFPCPLMKIDTIAQDAHLEEKSQAVLIDFAKKMQTLSEKALIEYENSLRKTEETNESEGNDVKKREKERGPEFTLNGVKLNAKQILDTEKYFEPLVYCITNSKKIEFKTKLKQTYWDCEWTEDDDKSLLQGILEHGYGNWELIKADPQFNLGQKILISNPIPNDREKVTDRKTLEKSIKLKPQSKHLRTRIDYLIKVLQNQINQEKYGPNWKESSGNNLNTSKQNKLSKKKDDMTVNNTGEKSSGSNSSQNKNNTTDSPLQNNKSSRKKADTKLNNSVTGSKSREKKKRKHELSENYINDSNDSDNSETNSDSKKKRNNSAYDSSANHHHHNHHDEETHSDAEMNKNKSDNKKEKKTVLNEKIFNECKNILRPVKKALKNLDIKEDKDHLEKMKTYLLEIGDKINEYLTNFSDPEKIKEWRIFLWTFVSKFTTWDSERLKNVYRKFANTRDEEEMNKSQQNSSNKPNNWYNNKSNSSSYGSQYQNYNSNKYSSYDNKKNFDYNNSSRDSKSKYSSKLNGESSSSSYSSKQQLDNRNSYREYDKNYNYLQKTSNHFNDIEQHHHHYTHFPNHSSTTSSYPDQNEMQYQNFHSSDFRPKSNFSSSEHYNQYFGSSHSLINRKTSFNQNTYLPIQHSHSFNKKFRDRSIENVKKNPLNEPEINKKIKIDSEKSTINKNYEDNFNNGSNSHPDNNNSKYSNNLSNNNLTSRNFNHITTQKTSDLIDSFKTVDESNKESS